MIKNARERATGRVRKPKALKANTVFHTMAHNMEDFPALKHLVRTQVVEVGNIFNPMIEAVETLSKRVDTLEAAMTATRAAVVATQAATTAMQCDTQAALAATQADLAVTQANVAATQASMSAMQRDTQAALAAVKRAAGKERAIARLRVVTDELERRAVATAQRQLRRAVILRGACTFLAIKLDTELYAVANDVYNACLPTDNTEAMRVRDARMRSSNGTHYALGDGISIADLLAMNKLARGERHQVGWPAISALQAMLESRHVVPPLGDDDVEVEASDRELFTLATLTSAEHAEYNRRHHTWHRGCTQTT